MPLPLPSTTASALTALLVLLCGFDSGLHWHQRSLVEALPPPRLLDNNQGLFYERFKRQESDGYGDYNDTLEGDYGGDYNDTLDGDYDGDYGGSENGTVEYQDYDYADNSTVAEEEALEATDEEVMEEEAAAEEELEEEAAEAEDGAEDVEEQIEEPPAEEEGESDGEDEVEEVEGEEATEEEEVALEEEEELIEVQESEDAEAGEEAAEEEEETMEEEAIEEDLQVNEEVVEEVEIEEVSELPEAERTVEYEVELEAAGEDDDMTKGPEYGEYPEEVEEDQGLTEEEEAAAILEIEAGLEPMEGEEEVVVVEEEEEVVEGDDGEEVVEEDEIVVVVEEEKVEDERVPVEEELIVKEEAYLLYDNGTDYEDEDYQEMENETSVVDSSVLYYDTIEDDRECANSTFGCCTSMSIGGAGEEEEEEDLPDVPAHGPNGEGCCLGSEFGCCPDNVRPAPFQRPRGVVSPDSPAWCSCEDSKFGCCPDDVSPAGGPDFTGCGCQFSPFGCCPDQYTAAPPGGADDCPCQTHEHGCCSDGSTAASGPDQAGCPGCEASEHGCCPDGFTPAEGAYGLGCECAGSEHGCCPDGASEAPDPQGEDVLEEEKGQPFAGCGEIPGEACHLDKDPGSCRENFTVRWFFDKEYGGCSRYWWSDCGGNANRFISSEECQEMCVTPSGSGRCYLPKVKGPCNGREQRWFFDTAYGKCLPFDYGGCLGNGNRFESEQECQESCVQAETEDLDVCSQPVEPGPCRGQFLRFHYDQDDGECRAFNYTGCMGNRNRFSTAEACENTCMHKAVLAKAKNVCTQPRMVGICQMKEAAWYFDKDAKRCRPFYYTGCGGNDNRFESQQACETFCPNAFPPEIEIPTKLFVVEEEETVTLQVSIEANPTPKITWLFKDGELDTAGGDERITQLPGGSVRIGSASLDDSGVYTVLADNGLGGVGGARNQLTLKVHPSKMPIEVKVSRDQTEFEYGEAISLSCSARGYPIPAVRWYRNNLQLPKSDRVSVEGSGESGRYGLTISRATPIDGGVYTCRATNEHESVSDSVEVEVREGEVPQECVDKPHLANCELIVRARFCTMNDYYADFCCKSCTLAGQIGVAKKEEEEEVVEVEVVEEKVEEEGDEVVVEEEEVEEEMEVVVEEPDSGDDEVEPEEEEVEVEEEPEDVEEPEGEEPTEEIEFEVVEEETVVEEKEGGDNIVFEDEEMTEEEGETMDEEEEPEEGEKEKVEEGEENSAIVFEVEEVEGEEEQPEVVEEEEGQEEEVKEVVVEEEEDVEEEEVEEGEDAAEEEEEEVPEEEEGEIEEDVEEEEVVE